MGLEKELKTMMQGAVIWLLCGVAVLLVWAITFAIAINIFDEYLWALIAATLLTTGLTLAAGKLLRK